MYQGGNKLTLESHGCCKTPNSSHSNTEQSTDSEELLEGVTVGGGELKGGNDKKVHNHGPFPSVKISGNSENSGSDGTEEKSQGD